MEVQLGLRGQGQGNFLSEKAVWHLLVYDVVLWRLKRDNLEVPSAYGHVPMDSEI